MPTAPGLVLLAVAALLAASGGASARTLLDAGVVAVEADIAPTDRCTVGLDAQLCLASWETGGTPLPGDDDVAVNKDVRDVTLILRPPRGPPLEPVTLQPNDTRVPQPLAGPATGAWSMLDRTLPAHGVLTFEDRSPGGRDDLYGPNHRGTRALFVTLHAPVPVSTPLGEVSSVGVPVVCWDLVCGHAAPDSIVRADREEVAFFPDNVLLDGWSTDRIVEENTRNESNGLYDCSSYVVDPGQAACAAQRQAGDAVAAWIPVEEALTPDVATSFHVQRLVAREPGPGAWAAGRAASPVGGGAGSGRGGVAPPGEEAAQRIAPVAAPAAERRAPAPGDPAAAARSAAETLGASSLEPAVALPPTVVAAAAALLLGFALYHRIARHNVLASRSRRRIVELLGSEPGLRTATIARRAGLDFKTTLHHVRTLERLRIVMGVGEPQRRYFLTGLVQPGCHAALAALAVPAARQLYFDVLASGPAELQAACQRLGVARSTVSEAATHLARAGLMGKQRRNRRVVLTALPSPAAAALRGGEPRMPAVPSA